MTETEFNEQLADLNDRLFEIDMIDETERWRKARAKVEARIAALRAEYSASLEHAES